MRYEKSKFESHESIHLSAIMERIKYNRSAECTATGHSATVPARKAHNVDKGKESDWVNGKSMVLASIGCTQPLYSSSSSKTKCDHVVDTDAADDVECTATGHCRVKTILPIMAVKRETGRFMLVDHVHATPSTDCGSTQQQRPNTICENGHCVSLMDAASGEVVCNLNSPLVSHGYSVPDFDHDFKLTCRYVCTNCCHSGRNVQQTYVRNTFVFKRTTCAKFKEYPGIDLAVVKHAGQVHLVTSKAVYDSNTPIAHIVARCVGIASTDQLFESEKPHSRHVVYLTLCQRIRSDGSLVIVDRSGGEDDKDLFLVYKHCVSSPTFVKNEMRFKQGKLSKFQYFQTFDSFGGRLQLERLATMDCIHSMRSVGRQIRFIELTIAQFRGQRSSFCACAVQTSESP